MPPADLPPGPDFFRFSDDEAFAAALREQGLASLDVTDITFVQRFASADELWDGMLGAPCECPRSWRASRERSGDASGSRSIASSGTTDVVTS
jgi:hypothetical protein